MSTYEEQVEIGVDEERVAGTFITPGTLLPGVLFVHGWGGSQQQYLARAKAVAALGCICLTFNLRGHVETKRDFETVSRSANLRDLVAAYDLLAKRRHVDTSSIAVVGSSYGGYLASILTSMRPVRWLALRAPALYMDSGWDLPKLQLAKAQDLPNWRRTLVRADDNRALQACNAFRGDMLIIESEFDSIIPASVITSYRQAATQTRSLTYRCLKGADHGLTGETDQKAFTLALVNWMKEMVSGARTAPIETPQHEEPVAPEAPPEVASAKAGRPLTAASSA